ncbi:MAG: MBOAT family protein [Clostridia bacterium]|nr:MBOAT family protein [Clostridia bacterium]
MVFSSLLFVYAFLPLCLLSYVLIKGIRGKNVVLLIFSLIFYAWGEPKYILLLVGMVTADWLFAMQIEKAKEKKVKKWWLVATCVVNLGLIGVFKYANFFDQTFHSLFKTAVLLPAIALPIGISFYTFQLLSYVVDVYRGEVAAQKRLDTLLLYAGLFHQCVAGPIVRYKDVMNELTSRTVDYKEISSGITRFIVGLSKKALLANVCGSLADSLLMLKGGSEISVASIESSDGLALWVSMLAYMLQIYLDFSAYSDMAIGMGRMVGLHYKENFQYPYIATSVRDFWKRWHISLSSFFKDYVYIPLGGNRKGIPRTILNMFIVWLLTGLWHGASWNFVLWGLYYFIFLAAERLFLGKWLERIPAFVGRIYSLIIVYFGWILFRFKDFSQLWAVLRAMVGAPHNFWTTHETNAALAGQVVFLLISIIACTPLMKWCGEQARKLCAENQKFANAYASVQIVLPGLLLALSTMALVGDSYNPFLYFQF